ncbi:hypothetical protein AVEN_40047-1 [Araneus ventricosus]|uniref:Uncharacterized protein n=1 Tax=Araneus ventricosus TaxID=182803 RepID=A0A4Y2TAT9_ARAVE|nr:hypothetical protein AVEN_171107-1 [Araneus ventricosus]GBO04026.1 hypothetical protein AVEN_40047-1 [Araneus ventricosus]
MPIPRGCLPKSEIIRDFQSELINITQLSSVLRSLKPSSRLLMQFLPPSSPRTFSFYSLLQGVELRLPFPSLDNGTLVDQQLTFLVVNPYYGKVLEFRHHRPIQG